MPDPATERTWKLPNNLVLTFSYYVALPLWVFEEFFDEAIAAFRKRKDDKTWKSFLDDSWDCSIR